PVDSVIPAIGEIPDVAFLPKEISITSRNRIVVDPITLETTKTGIFAGGDAVTGPASVIEAIAAGKRAAVYIDRYLRGKPLKVIEEVETVEATWLSDEELKLVEKKPRQPMPTLNPYERAGNFKEVELGLSMKSALAEARRCLLCGPCEECLESEDFCETDNVLIDENKCSGCGACVIICPFGALEKDEKGVAKVFENICKSCGLCAASCPEKAIAMSRFSDTNIITQALAILERRK
ncbi:MAG: 4Fe-4S binding protein, partial [Candidatus Bathyarchaeales archaeon]